MRWNSVDALALGVLALGVGLIALERAPLAKQHHGLKANHDAYLLPPPSQTVTMSLGYRSALADLIFGHVLVANGIRMSEKRLFEFAGEYLETINELDPKFRDPYRYSDSLLTLQVVKVPPELYRQARRILLRGTEELPFDQELWASAGQFMAYLAPAVITDPEEQKQFRADGARLLAHSCELIGNNPNIPYHCLSAGTLFDQMGHRDAKIRFLKRTLALVDDPELIAQIRQSIAALGLSVEETRRSMRLDSVRKTDLPRAMVPRTGLDALGPSFDPAACAGRVPEWGSSCTTSIRDRFADVQDDSQ